MLCVSVQFVLGKGRGGEGGGGGRRGVGREGGLVLSHLQYVLQCTTVWSLCLKLANNVNREWSVVDVCMHNHMVYMYIHVWVVCTMDSRWSVGALVYAACHALVMGLK